MRLLEPVGVHSWLQEHISHSHPAPCTSPAWPLKTMGWVCSTAGVGSGVLEECRYGEKQVQVYLTSIWEPPAPRKPSHLHLFFLPKGHCLCQAHWTAWMSPTASAPVPSQHTVFYAVVFAWQALIGSCSPVNTHGRQKAFVRRERSELPALTLLCGALHGMYIQEICHLTAWPGAQRMPSLMWYLIHRWHICNPRQPRGCSKSFKEWRRRCWAKQRPSQEKRYQHLNTWLQWCLILSFTRMIKETSLNLEQSKWNKG